MQRAVNPQTGEVLFLVNNQWVPPLTNGDQPTDWPIGLFG
jgi:hypothetical protein